jgi:hypothetical protein
MLIEEIQEWNNLANSLSAKNAQIPRTQIAGMRHGSSGFATQNLRGLTRPSQVRAVDMLNLIVTANVIARLSRFVQTLLIQRNIKPPSQTLIPARKVECRMPMPNNQ